MESTALRRLALRRGYICVSCVARAPRSARRDFHASPLRRQSVLEKLEARGLVNQIAGNRDTLSSLLSNHRVSVYAGIDPTAPSLHLGHLLPLMVLFWLHNHGHNVISLIGGATSRVGDPSGRLTSREKVDVKEQRRNFRRMWSQTEKLWELAEAYGKRHGFGKGRGRIGERRMLDNAAWLDKLNVLDFLRVLGNGVRVGTMLGRDTVRNKMEKGDGMSFSEFTYPLLQGWDWWHMYKTHGVQVQVGGADQYGNIVAGMDAVRFIAQSEGYNAFEGEQRSMEPMGLTVPLLTTATGEKFGKSAGNAIWLDLKMTSSFDLYGFLLKTADVDVERYLKLFTFVSLDKLSEIMTHHRQDPGKRIAQHLLASEILELVHGPQEAEKTRKKHEVMRKPTLESLTGSKTHTGNSIAVEDDDTASPISNSAVAEESADFDESPKAAEEEHGQGEQHIILAESKVFNLPFATILRNAGLASSKSEATRMINAGGVYVARRGRREGDDESGSNGGNWESRQLEFVPLKLLEEGVSVEGLLIERQLVLRLGKWKVRVVQVVDNEIFECGLLRV